MNCPSCGANVSDGAKFCPKCGTRINAAGTPGGPAGRKQPPKPVPTKQPPKPAPQGKPPKQKKSKNGLIAVLVTVLVLALCACGGYVGYRLYQKLAGQTTMSRNEDREDKDWEEDEKPREKKTTEEETAEEETTAEETSAEETLPAQTTSAAPESTAYGEGAAATTAWNANESQTTAAWDINAAQTTAAWDINQAQTTAAWDINSASPAADEYILPDSSTRYLTGTDIAGLTSEELRLARNEIYARHGRKFKDEALQAYFNSKSWYAGTIEPERFSDDALLSDVERKNLELIKAREAVLN
ncbi:MULTISPECIES: YARHG domain-containing protein [Enterocloster]|uniref:YARHG domain-containing protein n=1 Tax=Enterocloster TaxID=2719313 RepID=UPI000D19C724|nr:MULTISPECIES: YARHG domain-containing protein [Enterocloster]MDR3759202.1 YARHG domain-containing protein [Enterocloster sp.]PST34001.1 hypothetical protein C7256_06195 [Enterocloster lavalensis]